MSEPTAVNARTKILDIIASWGIVGLIRDSIADVLEAKDQEIADLMAKLKQAQARIADLEKDEAYFTLKGELEQAQSRGRTLREALTQIRRLTGLSKTSWYGPNGDVCKESWGIADTALAEPTR